MVTMAKNVFANLLEQTIRLLILFSYFRAFLPYIEGAVELPLPLGKDPSFSPKKG